MLRNDFKVEKQVDDNNSSYMDANEEYEELVDEWELNRSTEKGLQLQLTLKRAKCRRRELKQDKAAAEEDLIKKRAVYEDISTYYKTKHAVTVRDS